MYFPTSNRIEKNVIFFPPKYSSYLYSEFQANPLKFGTQNACLKRPYFGEIEYGENDQKRHVCKPMGASV